MSQPVEPGCWHMCWYMCWHMCWHMSSVATRDISPVATGDISPVAAGSRKHLSLCNTQFTSSLCEQHRCSLSTQFTYSHFGVTLGSTPGHFFRLFSTFSDFVWGCSQSVQGSWKSTPGPFEGCLKALCDTFFGSVPEGPPVFLADSWMCFFNIF